MPSDATSTERLLTIYKGLVEVSALINSITDYNELLRAVIDVARRVIHAEAASIFLLNKETGDLELTISSYSEGDYRLNNNLIVPKGRGIAGWVSENCEGVLIRDAYSDPRFYADADKATGFHTRSILCAPLKHADNLIGVLQLLNPRDRQSFDEQDLEAFIAYANMVATAMEKLRSLETMRQQERIRRDLAVAAEIQQELLSLAIPSEIPGFDVHAYNAAASNVGGDFYDVFVKSPYEIMFAIGDVSGKGISAALLMAQTLSALQFVFRTSTGPANALMRLNEVLCDRIVRGMFITAIVGRVVLPENRIEMASAGHCLPILLRRHSHPEEVAVLPALPLGIEPRTHYSQTRLNMNPGDYLILYTDGLSESRHSGDGKFFDEILHDALCRDFSSARQLVEHLVRAERIHRGPHEARDDLTILAGGFR